MDLWISHSISSGFADFTWVSELRMDFQNLLGFHIDFWISGWISETVYEISHVSHPSPKFNFSCTSSLIE